MQLIKRLGQRGDTIVEVLIAIAFISGVLATSYAIVNRNSRSFQQGHERIEALKLAEEKLELLRNGTAVTDGVSGRYTIDVQQPIPADLSVYNIQVTWDGVNGAPENINLKYRK